MVDGCWLLADCRCFDVFVIISSRVQHGTLPFAVGFLVDWRWLLIFPLFMLTSPHKQLEMDDLWLSHRSFKNSMQPVGIMLGGVNRYTNDIGNRQPDQQVKVVDTNCLISTHYCSEAQNLTHWHWWPRASPTDPVETSREIQKFKRQKWQCNSKCPLSICISSKLRDCLSVCPSVRLSVCLFVYGFGALSALEEKHVELMGIASNPCRTIHIML